LGERRRHWPSRCLRDCGGGYHLSRAGAGASAQGKARYVGLWDSGTGLQIELTKAGQAKVAQTGDSKVAACNTPLKPGETKAFNATFRGDDFLELAGGALGEAKVYRIQQRPHQDGKQMKMTLNASDPYQETNGMVLVRKEEPK